MRKMKRLLPVLLASNMMLFCANSTATPLSSDSFDSLFPTDVYAVKVLYCPEADMCLMDLIGEPSILGKRVVLRVGDYQVPSIYRGRCSLESLKGYRATTFLEEMLRTAEVVLLINAHKAGLDPTLRGDLLVDGRDVTVLMFEMHIAVPKEAKVDWCEDIGRRIEI